MSPSTPPSPPYLLVVFGFQYYNFKRTYFFCPLSSLIHRAHVFYSHIINNFSFSFFVLLNNGDEFTRKRTETKSVSRREKILLPRESLIFSPEGLCTPREGMHRTN